MDEIMKLWEEIKFQAGIIGNELIPIDKREVLIGLGDRNAPILFIGNDIDLYLAEDYKVAPNSSGEFLLKLLDIVEITPTMYYVTTLTKREVKFKHFINEEDREKLLELLFMQIALINPKIIVFLGLDTAQIVLKREIDFDRERGEFTTWKGDFVI